MLYYTVYTPGGIIVNAVELIEDGALDHLDQVTRQYTTHPHYYGYISPAEQQAQETRIICRIHATKITLGSQGQGSLWSISSSWRSLASPS